MGEVIEEVLEGCFKGEGFGFWGVGEGVYYFVGFGVDVVCVDDKGVVVGSVIGVGDGYVFRGEGDVGEGFVDVDFGFGGIWEGVE